METFNGVNQVPTNIIDAYWFQTNDGETIGIVLTHNGKNTRAFIGNGFGSDCDTDAMHIAEYGAPIQRHLAMAVFQQHNFRDWDNR